MKPLMDENHKYILIEVELSTGTVWKGYAIPEKSSQGMSLSEQLLLHRNSVVGMFADEQGFIVLHPMDTFASVTDDLEDVVILNREYIASVYLAVDYD